jgi:hypothetical protein
MHALDGCGAHLGVRGGREADGHRLTGGETGDARGQDELDIDGQLEIGMLLLMLLVVE